MRWAYSGIRPLYDDGASKAQEATRDYVLKLDHPEGGAPLLSVFGGKITTFRKLAESAMEKIEPFFPQMGKPWTHDAALPGGDFPFAEVEARIAALAAQVSVPRARHMCAACSAPMARMRRRCWRVRARPPTWARASARSASARSSGSRQGMGAQRR